MTRRRSRPRSARQRRRRRSAVVTGTCVTLSGALSVVPTAALAEVVNPWGTPVTYSAGSTAYSWGTTFADLDDDGNEDLLTSGKVTGAAGFLQVRMGVGDGTFGSATQYDVATNPLAIAAGDFNDDTFLDVATVNQGSSSVTTLYGDGGGGLSDRHDFFVASTPTSLAVGDLDGDDLPDIVTSSAPDPEVNGGAVSVLLNDVGNPGAFQEFTKINTTGDDTNVVSGVALGDLNGDENLDIVAAGGGLL